MIDEEDRLRPDEVVALTKRIYEFANRDMMSGRTYEAIQEWASRHESVARIVVDRWLKGIEASAASVRKRGRAGMGCSAIEARYYRPRGVAHGFGGPGSGGGIGRAL